MPVSAPPNALTDAHSPTRRAVVGVYQAVAPASIAKSAAVTQPASSEAR